MALPKVNFSQSNGNLFAALPGEDHISALVFDVATYPSSGSNTGENGDVYEVFSLKEAEDLGFTEFDPDDVESAYEGGVPHYHIKEFFRVNPNGHLFIGVNDITDDADFSFLGQVQTEAQGKIRQMGVYTKQDLWIYGASVYTAGLIGAITTQANADAALNKPYVVLLQANTSQVDGDEGEGEADNIAIAKIPTIIGSDNKVAVLLGQGYSTLVQEIQGNNTARKCTVGTVGTALGCVSLARVHENIGWVAKFNIGGTDLDTLAFGWGDITDTGVSNPILTNSTPYDSLTVTQLDALEDKGYIFPSKIIGYSGTFFTGDRTASADDYRSISRNRVIDKSRRNVRAALLPTLNQPLYVSADGTLSPGTIGQFKSLVSFQLSEMRKAGEISDFRVEIDPAQEVLATDTLAISYRIIPVGTNKTVEVEIGFAASVSGGI